MSDYTCEGCGTRFTVPAARLAKYPGWTPRVCMSCRGGGGGRGSGSGGGGSTSRSSRPPSATLEDDLPVAEVLARYAGGPTEGVFTDGACEGNPGPGGWGAVYVVDDEVVAQAHDGDPATTNNRMELQALLAGVRLVPPGVATTVYSDSQYVVKSLTLWARGWEAKGWTKKGGPIKNLELIQQAYAAVQARPELRLQWIKAHDGSRWNEYADALATAYRRDVV